MGVGERRARQRLDGRAAMEGYENCNFVGRSAEGAWEPRADGNYVAGMCLVRVEQSAVRSWGARPTFACSVKAMVA